MSPEAEVLHVRHCRSARLRVRLTWSTSAESKSFLNSAEAVLKLPRRTDIGLPRRADIGRPDIG
jgi:hypothetical protein